MKKLNFRHIGYVAGFMLLFHTSCNEITDMKPINEISETDYWKNSEQFKLAANEFYTYLLTFNQVLYDGPHSDLRGDLVAPTNVNIFSAGTNALGTNDGNWNGGYARLRAINLLLDKASTYATPADIAQYEAEAKFFRAYVYFDLLQQFGGVPIITKPMTTTSAELQAPRNSRAEVVDLIIKDLEEAIPALPTESVLGAANKGRISKGAAQAFLARVGLYEGTWQKFRNGDASRYNMLLDKAIANSDAVITSNQYELFAPPALGDSAQKYLFILENEKSNPAGLPKAANREYILANRYDFNLRQIRQNVTHTWITHGVTRKLAEMYLAQDGLPIEKSNVFQGFATTTSEYMNRDNRMTYNMMRDKRYHWDNENPGSRVSWAGDAADIANSRGRHNGASTTGYQNQKWTTERRLNDNEEGYDWPVIRLAEVYLIYAEAVFERNGAITDPELDKSLNLVRNRVNKNMPKLSNGLVAANGLDMRTEIRRERTVELHLEGFRVDDLKRWKTAEIEMPMPLLGVKWRGTEWETKYKKADGTSPYPVDANGNLIYLGGRQWNERNYLLPIPTQQIELNPNLEQNPGWN